MITIAIPTYNRVSELRFLLDEIVSQVADVPKGQIDVVVSDNASTDGTEGMIAQMKERFAQCGVRLVYVRNDTNIGFSRNVIRVVEAADGDYVLLMSDDDGFEPGALGHLHRQLLFHPEAAIFFLKSVQYSTDLSRSILQHGRECSGGDEVFPVGKDYICHARGFPPALISGYVVRKASWIAASPCDFAYSISVHMLAATRMLLRGAGVVLVNRPCIKYRTGQTNTTWGRDELYPFRFYLDSLKAVRIMRPEADGKSFHFLRRVPLRTLAFYLIRQKVMQHPFSARTFWEYYDRAKCGCTIYSILIQAVRMSPRFIVQLAFGRLVRKENMKENFCWKGESKHENQ